MLDTMLVSMLDMVLVSMRDMILVSISLHVGVHHCTSQGHTRGLPPFPPSRKTIRHACTYTAIQVCRHGGLALQARGTVYDNV